MDQDADLFGSVLVGEGSSLGRGGTLTFGMAPLETCRETFNTCCCYLASEKNCPGKFLSDGLIGVRYVSVRSDAAELFVDDDFQREIY